MKSMKAKSKTKKTNGRFGRVKFPTKEVSPDLSQLRQPIDTSVSTLYHATKLLENGTDEVRSVLAYECDLVYECRICRSLFRSLANFISHKRVYCREKFDVSFARKSSDDYDTIFSRESNVGEPEKVCQESTGNDRILRSQVSREKQKKDLSAVVDMLQKKQVQAFHVEKEQLFLEKMQSNPFAVYQTAEAIDSMEHQKDLMKTQIIELEDMMNKQSVLLTRDGQCIESELRKKANISKTVSVTKHSDEESVDTLPEKRFACSMCNTMFSTKKTLAVHTRSLHAPKRICYPCPCCPNTFANSWSVYRHLFKVHRKSNEQVRKLRSQIQVKAFRKANTVAEDIGEKERSIKSTENNNPLINKTQEWMDHMESDAELQRCGGCGKKFDRKAALFAHSQYCQVRVAVCKANRKQKQTKKVIFPENATNSTGINKERVDTVESSASSEVSSDANETSIRVEAVSTLSKADWDMMESVEPTLSSDTEFNGEMETRSSPASELSDVPEIIFTSINKSKVTGRNKRKRKLTVKRIDCGTEENKAESMSQESNNNPMDPALLMEKKMCSIANLQKLQCLPCNRKFTSVTNLRRHLAIHIGWYRYRCKRCDFKCFVKCDSVAHCNKAHNAQNNRTLIENMIEQIPEKEYSCEEEILLDVTRIEENIRTPEVVEIYISPDRAIEGELSGDSASEKGEVGGTIALPDEQEKKEAPRELEKDLCCPIEAPTTESAASVSAAGLDPDLRRMVMEVIFGSSDANCEKKKSESNETEPHSVLESYLNDTDKQNNSTPSDDLEPDLKKVAKQCRSRDEKFESHLKSQSTSRTTFKSLESVSKVRSTLDTDTTSEKLDPNSKNKQFSRMAFENFEKLVLEYNLNNKNKSENVTSEKSDHDLQNQTERSDIISERVELASKRHKSISERLESDTKNKTMHGSGTTQELVELKDNEPMQDKCKPQRPIRNRIKPLNKDFVYDLKEVPFLKDSLVSKPFGKLAKKSLIQNEEDADRDRDQSSKRFKSVPNNEDVILCENSVTDTFDVRLSGESLKNNFAFSHCRSYSSNDPFPRV